MVKLIKSLNQIVARLILGYSLRAKTIIAFLIIALIPIGALAYLNYQTTRSALEESANQALSAAASQTAGKIESFINATQDIVYTGSQLPDVEAYLSLPLEQRAHSELEKRMADIILALCRRGDDFYISSYALLDADGQNVLDTLSDNIGQDESARNYFQMPLKTGRPYVSPVEFPHKSGSPAFYFSSPVRRNSVGEIIGVVRVRYTVAILQQIIAESEGLAGDKSSAILLDENHIFLAYEAAPELLFKSVASLEPKHITELQAAGRLPNRPIAELSANLPAFEQGLNNIADESFFVAPMHSDTAQLERIAVVKLKTQPFWLIAFAQPQEVFLAPVNAQAQATLGLAVMIVVVVSAVAIGLAQLLTGPIARLTTVAEQIAAGDLTAQAHFRSSDEIGKLAYTFNSMTARLRETRAGLEQRNQQLSQEIAIRKQAEEENIRLFEAEARRRREAETLRMATQALSTTLDLQHVFELILSELQQVVPYDSASVQQLMGNQLEIIGGHGFPNLDEILGVRFDLTADDNPNREVIHTRTPFILSDAPAIYNEFHREPHAQADIHSWLGAPMMVGEQIIGMIALDKREPGFYTEEYARLAQAFAAQAAIVIENARMFTELKQAEEALRESEERYRRLVESSPDGVLVHSEEKIVFTNHAGAVLFGAETPDQLIGKSVWDFILPENRGVVRERIRQMREKGIRIPPIEQRYLRLDGTYIDVEMTSAPFTYQDKPAIQSIFRDISERKQAEKALRLSDELLRQMPDAILVTDPEGNIERWLGKAEQIFGYTAEEAVGKPINFVHRPDIKNKMTAKIIRNINETGEFLGEIPCLRKDGVEIPIETTAKMVYDAAGNPLAIIGLNKDVTQRQLFEEQLRQSQKMEAIGRLAGGIAHDFNNILTVIIGNCDLILYDAGINDLLRKDIEQIKKVGQRAASLTSQLLAFSRQQILQPTVLNLNGVVANMERMLRRLIGENIDLTTILEPGLGQVKADPGQIEQVIMNLVVNARDAMLYGGKLAIQTTNTYLDETYTHQYADAKSGPYVTLAVSDTGDGIDSEAQAHIFEPFFTTKEQGKGTGLGLATVHGIINQSGGHIWVYSEPGQGTTFKIYLPQIEVSTKLVQQKHTTTDVLRGSETILLVEDEDMVRELAHRALLRHGYTVLEASYGQEALQVYTNHLGPIQLLVTDVVMPKGMSGPELAKHLSALHPEIKILYISGYTDNAIVHHGVLDPGTAFLQKPFTTNALARKVREALDEETK